jgi:addiction module HigA family antidote
MINGEFVSCGTKEDRRMSKSSTTTTKGGQLHNPHPGEILLEEFLVPMGISQTRLAGDIDVPVSRVAEIVNGRRAITADTALRLGTYFGTEPQLWLNLQSSFDLRVAERSYWPEAKGRIRARA